MKKRTIFGACLTLLSAMGMQAQQKPLCVSGIYPSLSYYNNEGECGTGAVVPWADRLWVITYAPHSPFGSSDKLYEITPDLKQIIRPESVGGTPANRMIHKESNQLFIGPYAIDANRNVRAISTAKEVMPGRHTGNARHLTDPANKIYYGTMEEGFYEVDVKTMKPTVLYPDGNTIRKAGQMAQHNDLLPGAHGKGLYSGQGVMVFSNNGEANQLALKKFDIEAGVLAEWDGKDWKVVRRNQFVEVTGPGGIYGNANPATDPIWATGWDHKSVLLGVRDNGKWNFYRLPKASRSYDGAHGWNTEWPRIRDIGTAAKPDYLMTMHGMFWRFPQTFTSKNTAGIRPRSSYLKVIGDFTRWNDQLVFGCDDAAKSEFLNKRAAKGGIEAPGQSHSNMWFTSLTKPDNIGTSDASGMVWLTENVEANKPSEPFLFAGWSNKTAFIKNDGAATVKYTFSVDKKGDNKWTALKTVSVDANGSAIVPFAATESGEWIRVSTDKDTKASVSFVYTTSAKRTTVTDPMFNGIANVKANNVKGGLLYSLGNNRRILGILANENGNETGYYEMGADMKIVAKTDDNMSKFIREKLAIPSKVVTVDKGSYLIVDDLKRRWRLPLGDAAYTGLMEKQSVRVCREIATERDMFSCGGTFFELPAENADGYAKIRPIASHNFRVNDYVSYRGMLVLTGIDASKAANNPHIFVSDDKKCAVWAGVIDDMWKLGKPVGKGGPWVDSEVAANVASDAYLFGYYDARTLTLSHKAAKPVVITVEIDPTGDNCWVEYRKFTVKPNEKFTFTFPATVQGRWIRFTSNEATTATAWLDYK